MATSETEVEAASENAEVKSNADQDGKTTQFELRQKPMKLDKTDWN